MATIDWVFSDPLMVIVCTVILTLIGILTLYVICCYYAMKGKLDLVYDEETGEPLNSIKFTNCCCFGGKSK